LRLAQLERQCARINTGELEQIVDETRERSNLLLEDWQGVVRLGESVLERLEHRLHRGDRGAQVVAGPGDELAASVEERRQA
jgi:hypothetical protein